MPNIKKKLPQMDELDWRPIAEWLMDRARRPWSFEISAPSAPRGEGFEFYLSYSNRDNDRLEGTVYGPGLLDVVRKAMKLLAAQEEAERIIAEASK